MGNGKVTGATFFDLTKVFDAVNHIILLRKLRAIGADDNDCNWFGLFLLNRAQVTYCENCKSDPAAISIGVTQRSILGPLLFLIYINDLPDVLEYRNVTLHY